MCFLIRDARLEDARAIAAIYVPFVLTSTATLELEAPDVAEIERRLGAVRDGGLRYLIAEAEGGVVAGYAYATAFRPRAGYRFTVEDSVYLDPRFAGRGLGRRLLGELMACCKAAGCHQMVAVIGGENPASVAMHASQGFVDVGVLREVGFKFEKWQHVRLMQREL